MRVFICNACKRQHETLETVNVIQVDVEVSKLRRSASGHACKEPPPTNAVAAPTCLTAAAQLLALKALLDPNPMVMQ